jgi:ABC-type uncharacterized transport system fused permease/ATPase subunit
MQYLLRHQCNCCTQCILKQHVTRQYCIDTTGGVASTLLLRTYLDLAMLELTTTIERAVVQRDGASFSTGLKDFAKFMVPLSLVNALLKYGQAELALRFRQRLTTHIIDRLEHCKRPLRTQ